jgi:hypothetical protein
VRDPDAARALPAAHDVRRRRFGVVVSKELVATDGNVRAPVALSPRCQI